MMCAYYVNAVGDNTDFLGRLLPLFWVIGFRVLLVVGTGSIIAAVFSWFFWHISLVHMAQHPTLAVKLGELIIMLSSSLWVWTWIYCSIKRVSE
jgi:hypothetical protein